MDWGTLVFFGVVVVIASNQAVMRVAVLRRSPWSFWTMQAVNVAVGSTVMVFGLPGFTDYWFVKWILGLLIFFHVIQNNLSRVNFLRVEQEQKMDELRRERERIVGEGPGATSAPEP
jgi:cell division protein FtsW (lipid II flippase)